MAIIPDRKTWVVLVVDDERDNLAVASMGLNLSGVTVHTAVNGQEALSLLENLTPTLILLDIDMPILDGYTAVQMMRSNPRLNDTALIAMTARVDADEGENFFIVRGFDGLLVKPFSIRTLAEDLEILLRNFKPRT